MTIVKKITINVSELEKIEYYDVLHLLGYQSNKDFIMDIIRGVIASHTNMEKKTRYIVILLPYSFFNILKNKAEENGMKINEYVVKKIAESL